MRTLYHGTIDKFAEKILKEGLKPVKSHRWDATKYSGGYNPAHDDDNGYIYMVQYPDYAADYAAAKVRYFNAEPGERFEAVNGLVLTKGLHAPVIKGAKPVVLKLSLTEEEANHLTRDEADFRGRRYHGHLPGKGILVLSLDEAKAAATPELNHQQDVEYLDQVLSMMLSEAR